MAVPTYVTIDFTRSISERKQIMLNVQSKRAQQANREPPAGASLRKWIRTVKSDPF